MGKRTKEGLEREAELAEAIGLATGIDPHEIEVLASRVEPSGDTIVVTNQGQKCRVTTDGEVQVLMGPGRPVEDIYEPPQPADAPEEDLPELKDDLVDAEPQGPPDHFELFKGEDKAWYFRRVAANGETVAGSEGYKRLKDAAEEAERQADGLEVVKV
jgi:uncharacterized protein YegP (UPF0339 family)